MLISIIIPVYNVEKYLHKCLESVVNQSYSNIELVLVNDGSTDESGAICDNFAQNDNRINVIHQKNANVAAARNAGLKAIKGDLVWFIDSDDWIEENAIQEIVNNFQDENLEIVGFSFRYFYENSDTFSKPQYLKKIEICSAKTYIKKETFLSPLIWSFVYKRDFLVKHHFTFMETIFQEDEVFSLQCFSKLHLIKKIEKSLYIYRQRDNSLTSSKPSELRLKSFYELIKICKEFTNNEFEPDFITRKIYNIISIVFGFLAHFEYDNNFKFQIIKELKQLQPNQKILKSDAKGIKIEKYIYNINPKLYLLLKACRK